MQTIAPQEMFTESTVLDVSRWGKSRLSNGEIYDRLKAGLDQINNKKENNAQDILIAETAIVNGLTLVTDDNDLLNVVRRFGGTARNLEEFLSAAD